MVYSFSNPTGRFCSSRSPTWIHLARAIFVHTHTQSLRRVFQWHNNPEIEERKHNIGNTKEKRVASGHRPIGSLYNEPKLCVGFFYIVVAYILLRWMAFSFLQRKNHKNDLTSIRREVISGRFFSTEKRCNTISKEHVPLTPLGRTPSKLQFFKFFNIFI